MRGPGVLSAVLSGLLLLAGCSSAAQPTAATQAASGGSQGNAVFAVSDAAADMGAVTDIKLTIDSIEAHAQGGAWATVSTEDKTFNLLTLRDSGSAEILAQAQLTAGTYDDMRLTVSKVVVVDAQGEHEAKLPSKTLRLAGRLVVESGKTATANFDVLADQSLHMTGQGLYVLAPVVKLETRSSAQASVGTDKKVTITGGSVVTDALFGMNAEGQSGAGLRVTADAALSITSDGSVVQTGGRAVTAGKVKAVDAANGIVTITTDAGTELVLHLASDTKVMWNGANAKAADIAAKVGSEVVVTYNAQTKSASDLFVGGDAKARAEASATLSLSGAIQAVDLAKGTVTLVADSGAVVTLNVASASALKLGTSVLSGLVGLQSKAGAHVRATYDAQSRTVMSLEGTAETKAQSTTTITGAIKSVNASEGTVVIATQSAGDVTLNVVSDSSLFVNGDLATMTQLKGLVGAEATADYLADSKAVLDLNARARAESTTHTTVSGVIKAVDAAKGAVTVTVTGGVDVVVNVTAQSTIVANGAVSALATLQTKVGQQATVTYETQSKNVTSIKTQAAATAAAAGTVKAVDAAKGTITIATAGSGDLTLNVTSDTSVALNGASSTLVELSNKAGAQVKVEYNTETSTAVFVSASEQAEAAVSGTIKAVDTAKSTVTIAAAGGADVVLKVTSETKVLVGASAATMASLASSVGAQVSASYDAQTMAAAKINADAQASAKATASGAIKAVNAAAGTITLAASNGQEVVIKVTADTKVTVNGAAATIAALAARIGNSVQAEYNAQTNVAVSVSATGQATVVSAATSLPSMSGTASAGASATVSGTLKAVDLVKGEITVAVAGAQDMVLKLTSDTKVTVSGSASVQSTLSTKVGSLVKVDYNSSTKAAATVAVS